MLSFEKNTLWYGLFNEFVFPEAKMNIGYLNDYYQGELVLKNNTLIKRFLQLIEKHKFVDITEAAFVSVLEEDGKSAEEIKSILSKIKEFKLYTKEQAKIFTDNLKRVCYKAYIDKLKWMVGDDIVKYVDGIKKFEYKSNYSDKLIIKNFSELDITDLVSRYSGEGYKSRYQFINNTFTCGGYIPGQIVMVVGGPSVGKSLFLQGEAVNFVEQGKRVHYIALGDLGELDLANRMTCMMARKTQQEVESDIATYFEMYRHKFSNLLGITVVPSGDVKPTEYVDRMLNEIDAYDVLMVDYDSRQ